MMRTRPEYDFKLIGQNLKKLRMLQHLTVEDVREYMQLGSVQAVYKWERGDSLPQADSLLALLELYQVHSLDVLVGESIELSPSVSFLEIVFRCEYTVNVSVFLTNKEKRL